MRRSTSKIRGATWIQATEGKGRDRGTVAPYPSAPLQMDCNHKLFVLMKLGQLLFVYTLAAVSTACARSEEESLVREEFGNIAISRCFRGDDRRTYSPLDVFGERESARQVLQLSSRGESRGFSKTAIRGGLHSTVVSAT